MNINAKYFGEITYEKSDTIQVMNGLFGFESYTDYLPLSFKEDDDTMLSLQSLDDETLSFILMNPFMICPDYNPKLTEQDLAELGANSPDDVSFYAVSVIKEPVSQSTINLRAPLAVNALNRKAKQVMLEQPEYTFRHIIGDMIQREEE